MQRELPLSVLLELAYVGNNSFKLNRERELNVARVGPGADLANLPLRRLYPHLDRIPSQESTGRGRYDPFQARLTRRLKSGAKFDASYVYGKSLDNGSGPIVSFTTDPFWWARFSFDRRHNFVWSFTCALSGVGPKGFVGAVMNDWQVSGITELRSALPLDIGQNFDTTLTGRVSSGLGNPDFVGPYGWKAPASSPCSQTSSARGRGPHFPLPAEGDEGR